MVPEERNPRVREIIVEPYRVIYELNADDLTVEILRVTDKLMRAGVKAQASNAH